MKAQFCRCGGKICLDGATALFTRRVYRCAGPCRRLVPWCFGAADDKPQLCDDCWAAEAVSKPQAAAFSSVFSDA